MPCKSSSSGPARIDWTKQSRYGRATRVLKDNVMILVPFQRFLPALGALLLIAMPVHAQQLYKWVDSNGRVQYSDRKPPDATKQVQEVRSTVSSVGSQGAVAGGKSPTELEKDFQKRRQEQTEAQQKQQQAATEQKQKSESCDAARRNLAALQSGQRMARFDKNGERVFMTDAEAASALERSQQQVKTYCN
jgi:Domain of unknown function (DUF4124)